MEYYFIFWLFLLILSTLGIDRNLNGVSCFSILILVMFFVGVRPVTLGTDTAEYYQIFYEYDSIFGGLEYLVSLLILSLNYFNFGAGLFIFFVSCLFIGPISYVLIKQYKYSFFLLLIFSSLVFWLFAINVIRQGVALSFVVLAMYYISINDGNRNYKFYLASLFSIGFHVSAIFPIFMLFIASNRKIREILIGAFPILFVLTIGIVFFGFDVLAVMHSIITFSSPYLPERLVVKFYQYYSDINSEELKLGFSYLISFLVVALSFYRLRTDRYKKYNRVSKSQICALDKLDINKIFFELSLFMSMIFVLLFPVFYKFAVFSRVLSYFDFFSIFLVCHLICFNFSRKVSWLIVVVLSSVFFTKLVLTGYQYGFLTDRF